MVLSSCVIRWIFQSIDRWFSHQFSKLKPVIKNSKLLRTFSNFYKVLLKIFHFGMKTYKIFVSTKNFPKEYKYGLGRDMERDVLVLMRCILCALLERNFSFQ